jgi:hypothetical protein
MNILENVRKRGALTKAKVREELMEREHRFLFHPFLHRPL